MGYVRKKRDKRSFIRKYASVLLFPVIAGGILVMAFFFMNGNGNAPRPVMPEGLPNADAMVLTGASGLDGPARPVYPYSVIPGGAYSRDELRDEIAGDPVVASHFAEFRIGDTRLVRATETRMMHIAYRLNDNLYWTANTVRIPAGEILITDGEFEARARCGNMVSAAPQEPVSEEEPLVEVLEIPELVMETPPEVILPPLMPMMDTVPLLASSVRPHSTEVPPLFYRPHFYLGRTAVPEPGILALMLYGFAVLGMIRIFRKDKE